MKKLLILVIVSCVTSGYQAKAAIKKYPQNTAHLSPADTLIATLSALNLSQYNGQSVDTLLARLPAGIVEMRITGWRSIRLAEILHVVYPNKVVVEIHVRQFQYMNPHWVNTSTPAQDWNITLFKKENIAFTVIFNGATCINGCENQYK
jgi:hypothetical protein